MPTILLPLLPGTLPPNACYDSEQDRLVAFMAESKAVLAAGMAFYNSGSTVPLPENRIYPWLRTTDGRWYFYSGDWLSPTNYDLNERRIWVGSPAQLVTYDGGDAGAPSDRSGPMWEIDVNYAAKFPVGVGTFPNGTAVAVGGTGGSDQVTIAVGNLPAIQRLDEVLVQPPTADNFFSNNWAVDVDSDMPWIRKSTVGKTTPDPLAVVPPFFGVYFIKWSGRAYRKA